MIFIYYFNRKHQDSRKYQKSDIVESTTVVAEWPHKDQDCTKSVIDNPGEYLTTTFTGNTPPSQEVPTPEDGQQYQELGGERSSNKPGIYTALDKNGMTSTCFFVTYLDNYFIMLII